MASAWQKVVDFATSPELTWGVLWVGLIVLTIGLLILIRTRWGQSQALGKCAALSLLVHLLLAAYATTVQIVTAAAARYDSPTHVSLVDAPADGDTASLAEDGARGNSEQGRAWDQFSELPAPELPSELDRPDLEPRPLRPVQSRPAPELASDLSPPLLAADLPAEEAPLVETLPPERTVKRPEAAPIDNDEPEQVQEESPSEPAPAGPDRQSSPQSPQDLPLPSETADLEPNPGPTNALPSLPIEPVENPDSWLTGTEGATSRPATSLPAADPLADIGDEGSSSTPAKGEGSETEAGGAPLVAVTRRDEGTGDLPAIYRFRGSPDKTGIAKLHGGSAQSEAAVQAALKWLAANQEQDGSWDASRHGAGRELSVLGHDRRGAGAKADTGITGLALLAFLGAGHTHRGGPYATNVQHGLEFLLRSQGPNGNLGGSAETFAYMYCHGISALALSEAYAMSGDSRLEQPVRRAVAYSVSAQHMSTGSWRYQASEPGDTSQLGWQLMALKSAEMAGVPTPEGTRDGMVRFLKSVSSGRQGGLAAYRPGERATRTMTAEALVCRQFLGMARENPSSNEAGTYLLGELPGSGQTNLYYWYYATLGMYQLQGDHWEQWNEALQATLIKSQSKTGDLAGSWEPQCIWGGYGGRVYSTALSALCLEVYYRFLPLYSETAAKE